MRNRYEESSSLSERFLDRTSKLLSDSMHAREHRLNSALRMISPPSPRKSQPRRDFKEMVHGWQLRQQLQRQEREALREEIEKAQNAACTFHPKINRRSPRDDPAVLVDRLYYDSKRRNLVREEAVQLRRAQEAQSVEQPKRRQINASKTLANRYLEIVKDREERMEQLRETIDSEILPFHPHLTEASRRIAARRGMSTVPVEVRLYEIPKRPESAPPQNAYRPVTPVSPFFLDRQKAFSAAQDAKLALLKRMASRECTFHPEVAPQSEALLAARGRFSTDITHRLAVEVVQEQRQRAERLMQKMKANQPSFIPTIDKVSEALAATKRALTPVHERLHADSTALRQRPSTPPLPPQHHNPELLHVEGHYNFLDPKHLVDRINGEASARTARLAEERLQKEKDLLAACTFQPVTHTEPRPSSARPILVRGLDRYLDLKSLADLQRSEKMERQRKIAGGSSNRRLNLTIPKPFTFSN